jgi:hypothetical protein
MMTDQSGRVGWWHRFTASLKEVRYGHTRRLKEATFAFLHSQVIRYVRHVRNKSSCSSLWKVAVDRQASADSRSPIILVERKTVVSGTRHDLQDDFSNTSLLEQVLDCRPSMVLVYVLLEVAAV